VAPVIRRVANAGAGRPQGLPAFSFIFFRCCAAGRSAADPRRTRNAFGHPAQGLRRLIKLSSSTDYFSPGVQRSARNRQRIPHHRAARPAPIRPHAEFAFSQGIPGIFSHFLRNYR
jgi:hypothetical protein